MCFWPKEKWPPCTMDLNLMDFSVWSICKTKACSNVHSFKDLKTSFTQSWDQIPQEMLCATAIAALTRFEAVVAQRGNYIE